MPTTDTRVSERCAEADAYVAHGRYTDAARAEAEAERAARELGETSPAYGIVLGARARRLLAESDVAGAEQASSRALELLRGAPAGDELYRLWLTAGNVARLRSNHGRALECYQSAVQVARALHGVKVGRAVFVALVCTAAELTLVGRPAEGERTAGEALAEAETLGLEPAMLALACRTLADAKRALGKPGEAADFDARANALERAPKGGTPAAPGVLAASAESAAGEAPAETLEQILAELNAMIGLEDVKRDVRKLADFLAVQVLRQKRGVKKVDLTQHVVFFGNPGTGKTSVARIIARIYHALGLLETAKLVEASRGELVAGYVGQTAPKVNAKCDEALGGVLFIDEAYLVAEGEFGEEAVGTLLQRMENDRGHLVVIVAGYPGPMRKFLGANPGFASRFTTYLNFLDFTPKELTAIFVSFAKQNDYQLTAAARRKVEAEMGKLVADADENFGNARTVRNVFEDSIAAQAGRLRPRGAAVSTRELTTLRPDDIVVELSAIDAVSLTR
jgi:tetratricopeptide (TPR) repeat protein